jgi:hypothetical protein
MNKEEVIARQLSVTSFLTEQVSTAATIWTFIE